MLYTQLNTIEGRIVKEEVNDRRARLPLDSTYSASREYAVPSEGYVAGPMVSVVDTQSSASSWVGRNTRVWLAPVTAAGKKVQVVKEAEDEYYWSSGKSIADYGKTAAHYILAAPVEACVPSRKAKQGLAVLVAILTGKKRIEESDLWISSVPIVIHVWYSTYNTGNETRHDNGAELISFCYDDNGPKYLRWELPYDVGKAIYKKDWKKMKEIIDKEVNKQVFQLKRELFVKHVEEEIRYLRTDSTNNSAGEKEILRYARRFNLELTNNGEETPFRRIFRRYGYYWQLIAKVVPRHPKTRKSYRTARKSFMEIKKSLDRLPWFMEQITTHCQQLVQISNTVDTDTAPGDSVRMTESYTLALKVA